MVRSIIVGPSVVSVAIVVPPVASMTVISPNHGLLELSAFPRGRFLDRVLGAVVAPQIPSTDGIVGAWFGIPTVRASECLVTDGETIEGISIDVFVRTDPRVIITTSGDRRGPSSREE